MPSARIRLVVGLGNPGEEYVRTRHNLGFLALERLAAEWSLPFARNRKVKGQLARGAIEGEEVLLLLPATYMNSSGESVAKAARYFGIKPEEVLIVCDDVALPFGELRLRAKGSSGGHNGLKSVESHLGTQEYARLRMGIESQGRRGELADYVLDRFTREESERLEEFLKNAVLLLEGVLKKGMA